MGFRLLTRIGSRITMGLAHRNPCRHQGGWIVPVALMAGLIATTAMPAHARNEEAGRKGAEIYCFMRNNGNSHQVSWDAAYAVIKRQGDRLFRTSPQHAAVLITEAVVQNSAEYPDCGRYLGDLYQQPEPSEKSSQPTTGNTRSDRYGY
jgi:hypothetical protein